MGNSFDRSEFTCNCGCDKADVSPRLVYSLQKLRNIVARPVRIISAFRCAKHNETVGGASGSQHLLGLAADIAIPGLSPAQIYEAALKVAEFKLGGIGIGPGVFHVDVRQVSARWGYTKSGLVAPFKDPRGLNFDGPLSGEGKKMTLLAEKLLAACDSQTMSKPGKGLTAMLVTVKKY